MRNRIHLFQPWLLALELQVSILQPSHLSRYLTSKACVRAFSILSTGWNGRHHPTLERDYSAGRRSWCNLLRRVERRAGTVISQMDCRIQCRIPHVALFPSLRETSSVIQHKLVDELFLVVSTMILLRVYLTSQPYPVVMETDVFI